MHKPGSRSAVKVIRLDEFVPDRKVASDLPRLGEPEPAWSSLPSHAWPEPIGSGRPSSSLPDDAVPVAHLEPLIVPLSAPLEARVESLRAEADAATPMPRLPHGVVTSWPVRFRADEADYVRLWFQGLWRIILTGGLYLPWARVRSRRFLLQHTRVAGQPFDYHEPVRGLLSRYGLAACLLVGVAGAWMGSWLAGMLATSLAMAVWPLLIFLSLTQRLAHISWAHRRLSFDGLFQDVYRALWAPLAGGGAVTWLLMAALILRRPGLWVTWGGVLTLWLLAMPVFVWTWFHFRQRHVRLGPMSLRWKAPKPAVLTLFLRTLAWTAVSSVLAMGLSGMALAAILVTKGRLTLSLQRGLVLGLCCMVGVAVLPYVQARLQNLVWNKTGNRYVRFRSKLSVEDYVRLQCRHAVLLLLTFGLYWPWAAIATRRMRTHAMSVWSRVDVEILKANWAPHVAQSYSPPYRASATTPTPRSGRTSP